jgi:murein DD-endopeptidase MepM/ murein hydrolase activator NlpD
MGRYVEIRHPDGWLSRYGHLKSIAIRDRQRVHRGDAVGAVGKSGNAGRRLIRPHLHFEVWDDKGNPVDPLGVMELARKE